MQAALPWLMFGMVIAQFALAFWTSQRSKEWKNSDEFRGLETRVAKVETDVESLSSEIKGDIKRIDGLVDRLEKAVARVEGFFFTKGA